MIFCDGEIITLVCLCNQRGYKGLFDRRVSGRGSSDGSACDLQSAFRFFSPGGRGCGRQVRRVVDSCNVWTSLGRQV
jgi:hypothetical protein